MTWLPRAGHAALLAIPGALTLFLAFNEGGYFPDTVALALILLVQILVVRVTAADEPAAGAGPLVIVVAAALGGLSLWALASQLWSDAPARALVEGQRVLMYALVFVLFGSMARRLRDMRWMVRGVALALVAICVIALITRLLPDVWSAPENPAGDRLSFPLTYWNALGLVGAVALVFCLHLASYGRESLAVRALAAAAIPLVATTVYFTFSRGAVFAGAVGLVVYAVLAFAPGTLAAVAAAAPPAVYAVTRAYDSDLLDDAERTSPAAVAQAEDLAVTVGLCAIVAAAAIVIVTLAVRRLPADGAVPRVRAGLTRWGGVALALVGVTIAFAVGAPGQAVDAADEFISAQRDATQTTAADTRSRFGDPTSPTRVHHWESALEAFEERSIEGHGAGMFPAIWARDRPTDEALVEDAHSLYLEVAAELGLVGAVLLLVALGGVLLAFVARFRSPGRRMYVALFAAALVWLIHAGIDWDWELPATGAWLFALGGAAAALRAREEAASRSPRHGLRVAVALGLLVVAAAPVIVVLYEQDYDAAIAALYGDDCDEARRASLDAIGTYGDAPQPYLLIGFCNGRANRTAEGVAAMRRAVDVDPDRWEARFGLAILLGEARRDPRAELRRALELNPREESIMNMARAMRGAPRRRWRRIAYRAHGELFRSGRLPFAAG